MIEGYIFFKNNFRLWLIWFFLMKKSLVLSLCEIKILNLHNL